jgi:hypothetical protein
MNYNGFGKKRAFLKEVISRHISRGPDENHGNPQSG